jgi:hypothetical protein
LHERCSAGRVARVVTKPAPRMPQLHIIERPLLVGARSRPGVQAG